MRSSGTRVWGLTVRTCVWSLPQMRAAGSCGTHLCKATYTRTLPPTEPCWPCPVCRPVKEVYVWKDQGWYGLVDQRKIADSWFLESMVKRVHWDFFRVWSLEDQVSGYLLLFLLDSDVTRGSPGHMVWGLTCVRWEIVWCKLNISWPLVLCHLRAIFPRFPSDPRRRAGQGRWWGRWRLRDWKEISDRSQTWRRKTLKRLRVRWIY